MTGIFSADSPCIFQSLPFSTNFYGRTDVHQNFTAHTVTPKNTSEKEADPKPEELKQEGECQNSSCDVKFENKNCIFENQFRGRQLLGRRSELPSSYAISLLRKVGKRNNDYRSDFASASPAKYFCLETVPVEENNKTSAKDASSARSGSDERKKNSMVSSTELWVWSHDRTPNSELLLTQWIALSEAVHDEEIE